MASKTSIAYEAADNAALAWMASTGMHTRTLSIDELYGRMSHEQRFCFDDRDDFRAAVLHRIDQRRTA